MSDADIVERPRDRVGDYVEDDYRVLIEARELRGVADEIERLRTRIVGLEAMLCDAQAEIERLRATLTTILATTGTSAIHDRAEAALAAAPKGKP